MGTSARPSFGIMTPPMNVGYDDLVRVWREADGIPAIEHAWLFDHLMPIGGDLDGPIFEGWTLLAALAAQTSRIRLGLMVTSNRFRPPAVLAKIATTVDMVSGGRLDFGIGAGSRPSVPIARREYMAHGLPYHDSAHAVGSLAEACTIVRRLWTEDAPFDFDGAYHHLEGAFGNPKPVQRPAHRSSSAGGRPRRCGSSPNTPTSGTSRAATSPTRPNAARCSTGSAATSAVIPRRSPARCSCRSPTTTQRRPAPRSPKRSTPASRTSSSGCQRRMATAPYSGWRKK